jgi:hypothetical protein
MAMALVPGAHSQGRGLASGQPVLELAFRAGTHRHEPQSPGEGLITGRAPQSGGKRTGLQS